VKIKYELKEYRCITPCPYGLKMFVGGLACTCCESFVEDIPLKCHIICSHSGFYIDGGLQRIYTQKERNRITGRKQRKKDYERY